MTEVKGFSVHAHDYNTDTTVFITNTAYDVNTITITMRDINYHSPDLSSGMNVGEVNMKVFDFLNLVVRLDAIAEKLAESCKQPDVTISEEIPEVVEEVPKTGTRRGRRKEK